nr:fimbrial protein [Dyella sp. ASV24]
MNKTLSLVVSAALASAAALGARHAYAADGTITFNGQIVGATCTITGSGAANGTGTITVTLPEVSASALQAKGSTAGDTTFQLTLGGGTNCANGKTAALWVEASQTPTLDTVTGALKNNGTATGVEVRMVNPANGQAINLAVNSPVTNLATSISANNQPAATIAGNTATLNYLAQYFNPPTGGAVSAGSVITSLTYSMQYN